jgi:hypothetical protein
MCLMMAVGSLLLSLVGCTPPQAEERVVAFVNGKPITRVGRFARRHEGAL